jgi:hypothetical protein
MAGVGRISVLLIDSPIRTLLAALRGLDADVKREIGKRTRGPAEAIWREEMMGRTGTRMESRLAQSARVGVTAQNVFFRAGAVGKLSSGTPIQDIAKAVEFGANPDKRVTTRSRKGKTYTRRMGTRFRLPRRGGYIAFPASAEAILRVGSLWVQTARRTIHETIERA